MLNTTAVSKEQCPHCRPTHVIERYTNKKRIFKEEEEVVEYNSSFYGAVSPLRPYPYYREIYQYKAYFYRGGGGC